MSTLEAELMSYAREFLAGNQAALGFVYGRTHSILKTRALRRGALTNDDAEDAATEAILYVQGRGATNWHGHTLMGLLNRAVDYMVYQQARRRSREVLSCDQSTAEEGDEDFEFPEDLEGFEERRLQEGADQHEYLTAIETTTPEDIVLGENLRQRLQRLGVESCGQRAWDIYAAHVLHDVPQSALADEYDMSQQRVSQLIHEVTIAIRKGLSGQT